MSRLSPQQGMMPSMLDRLIDPEADLTATHHGYDVSQMVAVVFRDLEDLLNTRQALTNIPTDCIETLRSIVSYGMPDLANVKATTPDDRATIGRMLESIILRYEPRLRDVKATLLDPGQQVQRTVKFRIDAKVNVDPAPEIAFDTILELTTGHSTISRLES